MIRSCLGSNVPADKSIYQVQNGQSFSGKLKEYSDGDVLNKHRKGSFVRIAGDAAPDGQFRGTKAGV